MPDKPADLNDLIDIYSQPMANARSSLADHIEANGIDASPDEVAASIRELQNDLLGRVWTTDTGVTYDLGELDEIVCEYSRSERPWLNDKGRNGLLRWLIWMCWHEGLLAPETDQTERIDEAARRLVQGVDDAPAPKGLQKAIEWLIRTDAADGAFVVVENRVGTPFVQFAGSADQAIAIDIPVVALSRPHRDRLDGLLASFGAKRDADSDSCVLMAGHDVGIAVGCTSRLLATVFDADCRELIVRRHDDSGSK